MKRRMSMVVAFAFCLGLAAIGASAQGKSAATPTVYLNVTIWPTGPSDTGIQGDASDGTGAYLHGSKGISAFFNGDGELIFRIDPKTSARRVWFRYPSPYEDLPTSANHPTSGLYADATSLLTTVAVRRDASYEPLQNLSVLGTTTECVQLQWGYSDAGKTFWSHNFHRPQSAGTIDVNQTSYGVVTCTAADVNGKCVMWEVEPKADSGSLQCAGNGTVPGLARLIDTPARGQRNDSGLYFLPFKLTLVRK